MGNKKKFRRLFYDLEVSPNLGFFWKSGYKLSIPPECIVKERAIICVAWKFEGENKIHSLKWNKGDDKKLIEDFLPVMLSADEVIGHNSSGFDDAWFRTRCLYHGIKDFPDIKSLDTLKMSKSKFRFNSNKLDYIAQFLSVGKKKETNFTLWKDIVLNNDTKSLLKMIDYCKGDVLILEEVFKKLEGYITHKTHVGVLKGKSKCSCTRCGSINTQKHKLRVSSTGTRVIQMQCKDCDRYFSVAETHYTKERE